MSSVTVDNETVIFEGDVPKDPSKVYDLLMGILAEQGRVVVSFVVDGVDLLREDRSPDAYQKIDVFSQTHHELTLKLIMETMKHLVELEDQLIAYSVNVLKTPWSEVFKQMDLLIEKIKPFAELLDNLNPYAHTYKPEWTEKFSVIAKDQAGSLDRLLKAFELGDTASVSNELNNGFLSVYREGTTLFSEEIIPYLKLKVTEGAAS